MVIKRKDFAEKKASSKAGAGPGQTLPRLPRENNPARKRAVHIKPREQAKKQNFFGSLSEN